MPIIRLFKARAWPGHERRLAEKLRATSAPLVKDQPAFLGLIAGGPAEATSRDFVFATVWRDFSGMKALFGEQWRESLLPEGYAELIESCSVEHYELTDHSMSTFPTDPEPRSGC